MRDDGAMGEDTRELRAHPEVLIQKLPNGEAVLLHMESEVYFGLDPIGARMWEALNEEGSIDGAVARLLQEFEVEREQLESDIRALAEELAGEGLLVAD